MRVFHLVRREDVSGVSGTGVVAEGVEFSSGWCALSWFGKHRSVAFYPSSADIEAVHGHGGRTVIVWGREYVPDIAVSACLPGAA